MSSIYINLKVNTDIEKPHKNTELTLESIDYLIYRFASVVGDKSYEYYIDITLKTGKNFSVKKDLNAIRKLLDKIGIIDISSKRADEAIVYNKEIPPGTYMITVLQVY